MARYLYSELASLAQARRNCAQSNNTEWYDRHSERIKSLVREYLPSGSGFDAGTTLDLDASHADRLVFRTSFHHMDENGFYSGWSEHTVTVSPSLAFRIHVRVSGRDRNDIKEYIGETFEGILTTELPDAQ